MKKIIVIFIFLFSFFQLYSKNAKTEAPYNGPSCMSKNTDKNQCTDFSYWQGNREDNEMGYSGYYMGCGYDGNTWQKDACKPEKYNYACIGSSEGQAGDLFSFIITYMNLKDAKAISSARGSCRGIFKNLGNP